MTFPVPTLSIKGWVTSPAERADFLMSHFYESDKLQSLIYGDNVSSLQWLIEQYGHSIPTLSERLRMTLMDYLGAYYDAVNIDVVSDDSADNLTGRVTLTIKCRVTQDAQEYSFGKLLTLTNSKFDKIIDFNNNGAGV